MEINVNTKCEVTLTSRGADILTRYELDLANDVPMYVPKFYKAGDTYCEQFWELMSIFGSHLYLGCEPPFENNIIKLD
jgi:hypothetical protein